MLIGCSNSDWTHWDVADQYFFVGEEFGKETEEGGGEVFNVDEEEEVLLLFDGMVEAVDPGEGPRAGGDDKWAI